MPLNFHIRPFNEKMETYQFHSFAQILDDLYLSNRWSKISIQYRSDKWKISGD